MKKYCSITILFCFYLSGPTIYARHINKTTNATSKSENKITNDIIPFDTTTKTIHIFVALCDNKYQGIVPVPVKIGNGQDPNNNLFWGCGFGICTYFKNSKEWKLVKSQEVNSIILERLIFKHTTKNYFLIADAYDGRYIKQCTKDFLNSSCGQIKNTLAINNTTIGISGNAQLIAYIGHDGLWIFN